MARAKPVDTTIAPGDEPGAQFAALAVALPQAWHLAALSLSHQADQLRADIERVLGKEATGRGLRRNTELLVMRLVAFLDDLDGDPDLEDDDREESGDREPSLGSFDRMINQEKSYRVGACDVDAELDTADDEPALGSLDHRHSQEHWATGDRRDLEHDGAESGIGDHDGLLEQIGRQDWQDGGMV